MLKSREIVIARYNEDISWSNKFENIRKIYNKGEIIAGVESISLPNVGREAHTYLYHIINNWQDLAEQTMFCQGRVNDHGIKPLDIEEFFIKSGLFKSGKVFRNANWGFINHIGKWAEEKSSGKMQKAGLTFGAWFDRFIGVPRAESFFFVPGANFCVHERAIKNRSLEFYKKLIKTVDGHINPEEAHYFERSWIYIFNLSTSSKKTLMKSTMR